MRTDFREERRWKIAVAYRLSTAVLEWHRAGNRETRKERGIVVDWSRPSHDESREIDDVEMIIEHDQGVDGEVQEDSDERPFSTTLISADYGSDDSDDEQELEKQEVVDALEPRAVLEEALGHAERSESTQPENEIRPKEEDVDDSSMLHAMQPTVATTDADLKEDEPLADNAVRPSEMAQPDIPSGLKPTSDDPIFGSDMPPLEPTAGQPVLAPRQHPKPSIYSSLRNHIAYYDYDKLVLDLDDLHIHKLRDAASDDVPHETIHALPTDVLQIFPELPFSFYDPPPPAGPSTLQSEGKKKTEKRDRDDPHKRADPTTHTKLTAMGPFMRSRPTLLAALNPAVRWDEDHWTNIDDAPVVPDFDASHRIPDEPSNSASYSFLYHVYLLTLFKAYLMGESQAFSFQMTMSFCLTPLVIQQSVGIPCGLFKTTFCSGIWQRNTLKIGVSWQTCSTHSVVQSLWRNVLTGNAKNATG
jgi:chromatin modification-related protein VID21